MFDLFSIEVYFVGDAMAVVQHHDAVRLVCYFPSFFAFACNQWQQINISYNNLTDGYT